MIYISFHTWYPFHCNVLFDVRQRLRRVQNMYICIYLCFQTCAAIIAATNARIKSVFKSENTMPRWHNAANGTLYHISHQTWISYQRSKIFHHIKPIYPDRASGGNNVKILVIQLLLHDLWKLNVFHIHIYVNAVIYVYICRGHGCFDFFHYWSFPLSFMRKYMYPWDWLGVSDTTMVCISNTSGAIQHAFGNDWSVFYATFGVAFPGA